MMKPNIEGRKKSKAQQKVYQKCPENLGPAKDISEDATSYGLHETGTPKQLSPIQKDAGGEKISTVFITLVQIHLFLRDSVQHLFPWTKLQLQDNKCLGITTSKQTYKNLGFFSWSLVVFG